MRGRAGALLAGVVVSGLVGCGTGAPTMTPPTSGERATAVVVVQSRWTSCGVGAPETVRGTPGPTGRPVPPLDGTDALVLPRLPEDFIPTAAVFCGARSQRRADGGTDLVVAEERAGDVGRLVAALRLPDEPRTGEVCSAEMPAVRWFAVLDADGRWTRPGVPVDGCGKPRIEVRDAIAALVLTPVRSRPIREIESSGAAASGCPQTHADMVAVETTIGSPTRAAVGADPLAGLAEVRLCGYRVPPGERGSAKPAGDFAYGEVLPARRRALIGAALSATGPARPCATSASRFALLGPVRGAGGEVYVELDGCQRILVSTDPGTRLGQGDPELAALLGG
ncbi:hypothetical protein [Plantactinospora sp. CA-290183]|uniref:hypothetical protein n=1 Tax=Plantactinospora sp. CA-290183 TaxID=3240006 RepID=UPI003D8F2A92